VGGGRKKPSVFVCLGSSLAGWLAGWLVGVNTSKGGYVCWDRLGKACDGSCLAAVTQGQQRERILIGRGIA